MGKGSSLSLEAWVRTMNSSVPFVCVIHKRWLCWKKSICCSEVLGKGTWSIARILFFPSFQRFVFKSLCQRPFVCFEQCSQSDPSQRGFDIHLCIFTSARLLLRTEWSPLLRLPSPWPLRGSTQTCKAQLLWYCWSVAPESHVGLRACLPAFPQGGNIQAVCAQDSTARVDAEQCGKTEETSLIVLVHPRGH